MAITSHSGLRESEAEVGAEAHAAAVLPALNDRRYVARQPILNADGEVHGYELLFRAGPYSLAFSGDGEAATRAVLDNSVVFGLERLTGGLPMFVNCTKEALLSQMVRVLPASHTVLEVLETIEPSTALIAACRELKGLGYRLALDDFEGKPEWLPLVEIADYIKVDLSRTTRENRTALMRRLRRYPARTVLERVETPADLELGLSEGFTLFQGYYFCRPVILENRAIPANRLLHLQMLQALHEEPLNVRRVSDLVKRDASLTYRLLRMVNSPIYATRKVVTSIEGALVLIGDEMFRRVATLAIASELTGHFPSQLLQMAFLRGRFCELAAPMLAQDATEQYLLGILSLLPAMLKVPMPDVANALPLRGEVRRALMGEANETRTNLTWIESYEAGEWERCDQIAAQARLNESALPQIYADSVAWAEAVMNVNADGAR